MIQTTKQNIRQLFAEIIELIKSEPAADDFFREFLSRIAEATNATGGEVFLQQESHLRSVAGLESPFAFLDTESDEAVAHREFLFRTAQGTQAQLLPPTELQNLPSDENRLARITQITVAAPLLFKGEGQGVVELFLPSPLALEDAARIGDFLQRTNALIEPWFAGQVTNELEHRQSQIDRYFTLAEVAHRGLDAELTAFNIANEARRLIECDRVSILIKRGKTCRLLAISGQDEIDRRSNIASNMETLTQRVLHGDSELRYSDGAEDLPPQIETALNTFCDETAARFVYVLPLRKSAQPRAEGEEEREHLSPEPEQGDIHGAMVIEHSAPLAGVEPAIEFARLHGSLAMENSLQYSRLFLLPVWRFLGRGAWMIRSRTLPKTLAVVGVLLLALLSLFVVPADFALEAPGALQPVVRHDIFAPEEAIVQQIHVNTGDTVDEGQLLVTMDSPKLRLQQTQVQGELARLEQDLVAANRGLLHGDTEEARRRQLFDDQKRLWVEIEHTRAQLKLVQGKLDSLLIHSTSAGVVTTWELQQLLRNRPVARGHRLLTVANSSEPWRLEVLLPAKYDGHVDLAESKLDSGEQLHVEYVLASDPGHRRSGTLASREPAAEMHPEVGHAIKMNVDIDIEKAPAIQDPLPGATVTAEVHCGKRPLGYVWFHQVYEWAQQKIFF